MIFRITCQICGDVNDETWFVGLGGGIVGEPSRYIAGWQEVDGCWICPKHTIKVSWEVDGKIGRFMSNSDGTGEEWKPIEP